MTGGRHRYENNGNCGPVATAPPVLSSKGGEGSTEGDIVAAAHLEGKDSSMLGFLDLTPTLATAEGRRGQHCHGGRGRQQNN